METSNKYKYCYIVTLQYPYNNSEPFFKAELIELAKKFESITIFPLEKKSDIIDDVPNNVIINTILSDQKQHQSNQVIKQNIGLFLKLLISELLNVKSLSLDFLKYFKNNLSSTLHRAKLLENAIETELDQSVFYSFWLEDPAKILAVLKYQKKIPSFVSRAHGFDLYEYRSKFNRHALKTFIIKQAKAIITISKDGRNYLQEKHSNFNQKIRCTHLGTPAIKPLSQKNLLEQKQHHVVSCSSIIPLKRVQEIFKLLNQSGLRIFWTHFGDGVEMDQLKTLIKTKKNDQLTIDLRGSVSNHIIREFYRTTAVSLFINLSEFEGIPVSIMEAMSARIPIFATNVGGVKECVSEQSVLIDLDASSETYQKELVSILQKSDVKAIKDEVYNLWQNKFNIDKNTALLYKELTQ